MHTHGMQLVWECRTDASKFFFPPQDFDTSLASPMVSCVALDTGIPKLIQGRAPSIAQGQCTKLSVAYEKQDRKPRMGVGGLGAEGVHHQSESTSATGVCQGTEDGTNHKRRNGGGDRSSRGVDNGGTGKNSMRPFTIDFNEEASLSKYVQH